ncbi:MAG: hypothetical protein WDO74_03105 [Pseudomonadota bacterium]
MRDIEILQLQALICNWGEPCCVREILAAGTDEHGRRLSVINVSEGSCAEDDGAQRRERGRHLLHHRALKRSGNGL